MRRELWWLVIGVVAYYGFLRFRGTIAGMPWAPMPAGAAAA